MNYSLSHSDFKKVCEVFSSSVGLHFSPDRRTQLSRNLETASRELDYHNTGDLIKWVVSSDRQKEDLETLAPYLTNTETYFWREAHVFDAFSKDVIPHLVALRENKDRSINIWCAGCSSGEEAYSIAISIYRSIPDLMSWKINILATDLNIRVIDKARTGIYGAWSFRNSPMWLRNRYMKRINDKEYKIIPEIVEMVTFSKFNLIQENYKSTICKNYVMDIIFCRNVLMYFTNDWAVKVSQNLFDSLSEDGWLIVASCELSAALFPELIPVNFPGAVLYRKTRESSVLTLSVKGSGNVEVQTVHSPASLVSADMDHMSFPPAIIHTQQEILCNKAPETDLTDNKSIVRALADNGYLDEALVVCNKAIREDKLSPGLYYLRATILQEQDKSEEAIKSLKQAIYIDPDYIMGHFILGNLFQKKGVFKSAKQYFNNALELLNRLSDDDLPAETEGLSAKHITEIITNNLKTQRSA